MTSPNDILSSLIASMASVAGFAALMTPAGGSVNVYAYVDAFPVDANLNRALNELSCPGCLVAWMGTAPGDVEGREMWRHRYRAHVRLGADASNASTYPDVLTALLNGIPSGSTVKFLQSFIHLNCLPMELPAAARKFGTNGLEYMAIDMTLAEIGDN